MSYDPEVFDKLMKFCADKIPGVMKPRLKKLLKEIPPGWDTFDSYFQSLMGFVKEDIDNLRILEAHNKIMFIHNVLINNPGAIKDIKNMQTRMKKILKE